MLIRPANKQVIEVSALLAQVYHALASADGLKTWWTADVEADIREGGEE